MKKLPKLAKPPKIDLGLIDKRLRKKYILIEKERSVDKIEYGKKIINLTLQNEKLKKNLSFMVNPEDIIEIKMKILKNKKQIKDLEKYINTNYLTEYIEKTMIDTTLWKISSEYDQKDIVESYLLKVDKNKKYSKEKCGYCKSKKLLYLSKFTYTCYNCNYSTDFVIRMSKLHRIAVYNEKKSNYKKIEYCTSFLNKLQIKHIPDINPKTFVRIREYIKLNYINIKILTPRKVRGILKKIGKSKIYCYTSYIYNKLTGQKPPKIDPHDIEIILEKFLEVESIWHDIKTCDRVSSLSYPSCIYKIIELVGRYDDYLKYFNITESYKNIEKLDGYWAIICSRLQWEYIPTYI